MLTLGDISVTAGKPIDRNVYLNSLRQAKAAIVCLMSGKMESYTPMHH